MLAEQTSADPWHTACAVFDAYGVVLAATAGAPAPFGAGAVDEMFVRRRCLRISISTASKGSTIVLATMKVSPLTIDVARPTSRRFRSR